MKKTNYFILGLLCLLLSSCQSNNEASPVPLEEEIIEITGIPQDFEAFVLEETSFPNVLLSLSEEGYESTQSLVYQRQSTGDPQKSEGSALIYFDHTVDASDTAFLLFYIKDTQGSNTMKIALVDEDGKESNFDWVDVSTTKKDTWVPYTVPMSQFSGIDRSRLTGIRIGQWHEGVYYLDDIQFAQEGELSQEAVLASSEGGVYPEPILLILSQNTAGTIRYTTDGSTPDSSSTPYTRPISITEDTHLQVVVTQGNVYSDISSFHYEIDHSSLKMPVPSPQGGTYGKEISITFQRRGEEIYYTTDGSQPSEESLLYTDEILLAEDTVLKAVAILDGVSSEVMEEEYIFSQETSPFLKTDGQILRDSYGGGEEILLTGVNIGGWLVMEEWQCPTNAPDQTTLIATLEERFGKEQGWELINIYQDHWFTETDFAILKEAGVNVLRLPISYFEMAEEDGSLKDDGFARLDWFIETGEAYGIYTLIDLHGAFGSQNGKDHSGNIANPNVGDFYGNDENIEKTVALWEEIARRYVDNPWVAGYDLLNEPSATGILQYEEYHKIYQRIRAIDPNHIIHIQAIWEPTDLPDPDFYGWENVVYQYHFYGWDQINTLSYQENFIDGKVKSVNEKTNYDLPTFVGEFTFFENEESWDYGLSCFHEENWSYTSWTYKVSGLNSSWGMYTQEKNSNTAVDIYRDSYETIAEKWSAVGTENFVRNDKIADIQEKYFYPNQ
ncbi:MAG: chitobiase/beta-hexosaminidase C-terminal domain-containing protein [Eubacteriales bacterium]